MHVCHTCIYIYIVHLNELAIYIIIYYNILLYSQCMCTHTRVLEAMHSIQCMAIHSACLLIMVSWLFICSLYYFVKCTQMFSLHDMFFALFFSFVGFPRSLFL